jgi:hypothetical protein
MKKLFKQFSFPGGIPSHQPTTSNTHLVRNRQTVKLPLAQESNH